MSDELTAIRTVLGEAEGPSDQVWMAARTALMAEIEAVSGPAKRRTRPARRRAARRWVSAAGLACALAVAGLVLLVTQVFVRGGAVQPSSAAAAVLQRAADAALGSPPRHLGPGQVWYTRNEATFLDVGDVRRGQVGALVSGVFQLWVGREHLLSRSRIVRVVPAPGSRLWQRRAVKSLFPVGSRSSSSSARSIAVRLSYRRMLRAPAGTEQLARWVLHAEGPRGFTPKAQYRAQIMFTNIHHILIEPMVPARLRAGLFRVAAGIRGIKMLGVRHDTLGRAGLAVGFVDHSSGYEDELLFDPTTYALLDYEQTTRHRIGRMPAGTITQETAFLDAGVVHRIGQRPR